MKKIELTIPEKLSAKITALNTAVRLLPNKKQKVSQPDTGWIGGIDLSTYQDVAPTTDEVFEVADKIFNWLTD